MVPSGGHVSISPLTVFEQLAVGYQVTFNCVESSETLRPAADGPTVTIWHCANHSVRVAQRRQPMTMPCTSTARGLP